MYIQCILLRQFSMWTYDGDCFGNSGSCLSDGNCGRGRASVISWRASWWL